MSYEEKMTIDEIRKYLHKIRPMYRRASKKEKGRLLDEMETVTKLHRKHLIRLITGQLRRKRREKQRGRVYGIDVDDAIRVIARSLDYPCAERLKGSLVWIAEHLSQHGEIILTARLKEQLHNISQSTLRRTLQRVVDKQEKIAHSSGPRQRKVKRVAREVLVRTIPWQEEQPGHFEVDLVHHSEDPSGGQYAHTIQMLDVATGWSECAAVLGRSYVAVRDGFERICARLPFAVLEVHSDNGSEFLNDHLLRFWKEKVSGVQLSRGRPFKKNDNRFVEENNHSLVRAYAGYGRLDTVAHIHLLNQLYEHLWWYHNFFQPVMHLTEKRVVQLSDGHTSIRRVYDQARPPFERVSDSGVIPPTRYANLYASRSAINPLVMRQEIETLIQRLYALPKARQDTPQNVYESLFKPILHKKGEDLSVALSFDSISTVR